jgi:hypothetical protein
LRLGRCVQLVLFLVGTFGRARREMTFVARRPFLSAVRRSCLAVQAAFRPAMKFLLTLIALTFAEEGGKGEACKPKFTCNADLECNREGVAATDQPEATTTVNQKPPTTVYPPSSVNQTKPTTVNQTEPTRQKLVASSVLCTEVEQIACVALSSDGNGCAAGKNCIADTVDTTKCKYDETKCKCVGSTAAGLSIIAVCLTLLI